MIEQRIWELGKKVFEELIDNPGQLLNPERRSLLWANGLRRLRSVTIIEDGDIESKKKDLRKHISWQTKNGLQVGSYKDLIAGIILPKDVKAAYYPAFELGRVIDPLLYFVGPTIFSGTSYPSEGYKLADKLLVPFKKSNYEGHVTTSALQIDNNLETLKVLNPQEREKVAELDLGLREYLVGGLFYMDTKTAPELVTLQCMKDPQVHNGIGTLNFADGATQLFTINSSSLSLQNLAKSFKFRGKIAETEVTLAQVAAFCELIKDKTKAQRWNYIGLEMRGGGSLVPEHMPNYITKHIISFSR